MIPKEILKQVRRIEIMTNRLVNEVVGGSYHSVFKGRGMEFAEVREYAPGDDVRTIDWNVTARTGTPFIKRFVEERELTVMLMVDLSGSTDFGTVRRRKSELAAEICSLLAFSAVKNNDRVGLTVFTDKVELFIPPKKGKNHVLRLVRDILFFKPTGRGTDIPGAIEHTMAMLSRKSVVFLLSDFQGANLRRPLTVLNRKHDLIALRIGDAREQQMPFVGIVPFQDPETGEVMLVDTGKRGFRERYQAAAEQQRAGTEKLLRQLRVDFVDVTTDGDYLEPIVGIFRRRAQRF